MATKKQKRAEALANHEAFMAEVRETGLAAQRKDVERREARAAQKAADEAAAQKKRDEEKLVKEARPLVALYGLSQEDAKRLVIGARLENPEATDRQLAIAIGAMVREEHLNNKLGPATVHNQVLPDNASTEQECI